MISIRTLVTYVPSQDKELRKKKMIICMYHFLINRFSTTSIGTHDIGKAVLSNDYKKAVELILMPRPGGVCFSVCLRLSSHSSTCSTDNYRNVSLLYGLVLIRLLS